MRILFTYLFKNIWEKKLRSILIVFAIAITTSMTFAAFGTSDNFKDMVTEKNKAEFGDANIIISSKENSNNPFLDEKILNDNLKDNNKVYMFNGSGLFKENNKSLRVNIIAPNNIENLQKINPINTKNSNINDLSGDEIIISKRVEKEFNLNVGDKLKIKTEDKDINLKIKYIALPDGIFTEKPGEMTIVVSNKGLSKLLNRKEVITTALVKSNKTVDELNKTDLKEYSLKETLNLDDLHSLVKQFTIPFYIMLAIVVLMAAFIIYSSFKVIIIERMGVIGTFRSIGATKIKTDIIILLESIFYWVIGAIFGGFLGTPILYLLNESSNQFKEFGIETTVNFSFKNLIIALLLSLVLCLISAIIPIIGIGKFNIKEIILGEYTTNSAKNSSMWILGIFFIVLPFIYIYKFEDTGSFFMGVLGAFLVVIGMSMIIPIIFKILSMTFRKIYRFIFGNIGILALENVGSLKNLINNGILICAALAAVTAIFVASFSVKSIITKAYDSESYNVEISSISKMNYDNILKEMNKLKDKNKLTFTNTYIEPNISIKDKKMNIGVLKGINYKEYKDYFSGDEIFNDSSNSEEEILNELKDGNKIILADIFKKKYKYKSGDEITLEINNKDYDYEIVGFLANPISAQKRNCLISDKSFKNMLNKEIPTTLLVKGNNISESLLKDDLNKNLEEYGVSIKTKEELKDTELKNNAGLMSSLESFSFMALIIGSLGIMNNLMVSFMQRRKEFAVLASVGMSKRQRSKMILIEGITIGIVGSVLGVITGVFVCEFIPEISLSLDTYLKVIVPYFEVVKLCILGILLMIIASLVPVLKGNKISIVSEIKYE
ncbi:FtsX-like permease family protein [Clostridium baratii]|uniref:FtsX-like permease family protein n=1 Tax=Clostridium baratii str. Sullivan TaxID=1415775 RepID=A0A0A7FS67_9CLOT|nr:FtsX-like permease family protein [Clostridium baratii]AIY82452.1 ftsX-like permease family protein [Clostridium baratii str. Sullivan]MDU1054117.1 FtsX-like permease family protein [Clostridium baratii]MDU4911006.1 FtsX-like permease family protein [Clostridium baratii]